LPTCRILLTIRIAALNRNVSTAFGPSLTRSALALACLAALAACATPSPGAPGAAASNPGTAPTAVAAASAPGVPASAPAPQPQGRLTAAHPGQQVAIPGATASLPAFATVTKDARRIDGLFTMWQKEGQVWIELKPEDFNRLLFLSPRLTQGLGEPGYYGGMMASRYADWGAPQVVEFRKIHNLVQLIARNETFRATPNSPEARAVAAAYSPSLLGSVPIASQPAPDSKAVLIEANGLFLGDMLGMAIHLQQRFRQNYAMDPRNSFFDYVRGTPNEIVFDVTAHYATATIQVAAPNAPAGTPIPSVPSFLPDVRSLFLGLHYSLARMPDKPMEPRLADPRVGYFTTTVADFSDDAAVTPRERYVSRWRLEKKEPDAPLSEPVRPITYWLDRTIPLKYRDAISRGILEWNKAFERIGFKNAIVVKTLPDDASIEEPDIGAVTVRWMVNAEPSFGAIGPHHVDPRTGEILDADIAIESLSSRNQRAQRAQVLDLRAAFDWPALLQAPASELAPLSAPGAAASAPAAAGAYAAASQLGATAASRDPQFCMAGDYEAEELGYGLDVLAARDQIDLDSPQADAWVQAYLTDVAMHEAGHTLGLRHNFRGSRLYSDTQLSDPEFTRTHALAGSVMDYLPVNLARDGESAGTPFQTTLGPYDYWAIEYAYRPLPASETPAQHRADLLRIAARNAQPGLEYGTDEDNFLGVDPGALQFDLGSDPVAFARKRFAIARELFAHQETRQLKDTQDYTVLRRSVTYALRDATRAAGVLLRQLGGVSTLRDFPGSGQDPMEPVPAARQRAALEALVDGVLAADSFAVSPSLQRRLAPDFLERGDASAGGEYVSTDYPVETVMLDFQRQVLAALMSDGLAQRLTDSAPKLDNPADALTPHDVYARLTSALWAADGTFGPNAKGDIPARRRELQRDYVNRLANVLLRTPSGVRVDLRVDLRAEAVALLPRIKAAAKHPGLSDASKMHLADCAETLRLALAAPMTRAGY
jgi:hypothetical protein